MFAKKAAWGEVYAMPANITADDLLRLPDDGSKNELYEGELIREEARSQDMAPSASGSVVN